MNQAPIVSVNNSAVVEQNQEIQASSFFSVSDPDGDSITAYRFLDLSGNANTGFFRLAGGNRTNGSLIEIPASQLPLLTYVGGSIVSNEGVQIQAFDGEVWSDRAVLDLFTVASTNQSRPSANVAAITVLANENRVGSSFISGSDPDGFPITRYFLRDRVQNLSFFTLNGVEREQGTFFTVEAEQLDSLVFNARGGGQDIIDVFVFDGARWSLVDSDTITIGINENRPTIESTTTQVSERQSIRLSDVVQTGDADGNTIKFIDVFDTSDRSFSGFLVQDGVGALAPGQFHRFPFDELDTLSYVGAGRNFTEQIRVRVSDGGRVSTNETLFFETISETEIALDRQIQRSHLVDIDVSTELFAQISNLDRPLTSFQFVDTTEVITGQGDISGRFETLANATFAPNVIHSASLVEFQDLQFRTGTIERRHDDHVYARGFDGDFFTDWRRVSIRTEPNFRAALRTPTQFGPLSWLLFQNSNELTYSFMTDAFSAYEPPEIVTDDFEGFAIFSETQRAAVRQALDHISELTDLVFREVADTATVNGQRGGTIRFGNFLSENGPRSHAEPPRPLFDDPNTDFDERIGGDIWFNISGLNADPMTTFNYGLGSRDYTDLLEDLGTALGLSPIFAGIDTLPFQSANDNFSVMSLPGPPFFGGQERDDGGMPSTYSLYDVTTLQDLYGINSNTRTGDTVYDISTFLNERDDLVFSIFDFGGRDTLSAVGSTLPALVDLREGNFSTIGVRQGNISITFGTRIEDAVGSGLNDELIGNDASNVMDGLDGNDSIWGGAGNDLLTGGVGNDRFFIGIGDDDDVISENALAGRDTLEMLLGFPGFDDFTEDLAFRRQGRDLVVDLVLDGGNVESTMTIRNQLWGGWRVETLQFGSERIDLTEIFRLSTSQNQHFRTLTETSVFGSLVAVAE